MIIRIPPFFSPRRLIQIPYHPPPGLHVRRCVMTSSNRSAPLCAQPPPHCNTRIVMAPRPGPRCAASQTLFHPHRERLCELIRRSILFHPKRFCACIPMILGGMRRVRRLSVSGASERPNICRSQRGVQHGCSARSPGAPAQRPALRQRREAQRSGVRCRRGLGACPCWL